MSRPSLRIAVDADEVARLAADVMSAMLGVKPDSVIGLPTGRTPIQFYQELARRFKEGTIDFARARTFNLDEWVGVAASNPASFAAFMSDNFYSKVNVPLDHRAIPNGLADNLNAECSGYEDRIAAAGGLDLVVLGLGGNGHIGFNEPGTSFESRTHIVRITEVTREANRYAFSGGEPPFLGLSMGIATIMSARRVLMLVTGEAKAVILARALTGTVTEDIPATVLQRHPSVEVIADRAAAGSLAPV